jgi:hypothetical protein
LQHAFLAGAVSFAAAAFLQHDFLAGAASFAGAVFLQHAFLQHDFFAGASFFAGAAFLQQHAFFTGAFLAVAIYLILFFTSRQHVYPIRNIRGFGVIIANFF